VRLAPGPVLAFALAGCAVQAAGQQPAPITPLVGEWLDSPEQLIAGLELAIAEDPQRYDLRWSVAREYSNAASVVEDKEEAKRLARAAYEQARVATTLQPEDVEGHYWLAVASGILAEAEGGRTKVRMAETSWNETNWILAKDSLHAGAHHLQGRIHAAVMRVNSVTRFLARLLLGGEVLGQASWERAESHLRRAAELDPDVPMHHFELAMTYRDLGREDEMRAALQRAAAAPGRRPIDAQYRQRAEALLAAAPERN